MLCCEEFHRAFTTSTLANTVHDIVTFFPLAEESFDDLWWVLEIGVDDDDRIAVGEINACRYGELMAKIPRKFYHLDVFIKIC